MAFALPSRPGKPRRTGITSIIDFGPDQFGWTGPRGVADLLATAAPYIDFAKIYALNALLVPEETIKEVVRLYREAEVIPYAGGIYLEYAYQERAIDEAIARLERLGIGALELSENYIRLGRDERRALLDRLQRRGFGVIWEFGRKNPDSPLPLDELEALVKDVLDQGIAHIVFEQSEFDALDAADPGAVEAMRARNWFANLLIEGDPYRFPKQHAELLGRFGPELNLANIGAGQALRLEGLRRGIGRTVDYSIIRPDSRG
ncbi:MAG: phosphosulfolactate synthase [Proteobacteria bacterium]|nr:phosphosulfolactate synthase [Pseudomonadota bacterium]